MLISILQCLSDFSLDHPYWTTILTILFSAYIFKWVKSGNLISPPGPYGLPLFGYLPFLGHHEYLDFAKLQEIYGRIFSVRLGVRSAIVLSDFKAIKEAFGKEEMSDRPPDIFKISNDIQHLGDMNLKDWKESRRFTLSTLRNLGMGKNKLEQAVTEEVQHVVDCFTQMPGRSEFNVHNILYPAINNIIISLICGRKLKDDTAFSDAVDSYSKNVLSFMRMTATTYYLPFLKFFVSLMFSDLKKVKKDLDNMERLMWKEIYTHEEEFDESSRDDYMEYFLAEMKKLHGQASSFTKGALNGNSQLLLMAGNDTTLSTIEWGLLLMAKHQDVQDRVYEEIVQTVGKERPPCWEDREYLPYLDAVLAECSRIKTIVPLADPHWASVDTKIGRYDVPRGTVVISNLHCVHMDPELWDKPEEFNPNRFLNPDGTRARDPEYFLPFSIGKRVCPGERLAKVEVFLFMGAILQKFKILPPSLGLNMESDFDIVVHPKSPFIKTVARD